MPSETKERGANETRALKVIERDLRSAVDDAIHARRTDDNWIEPARNALARVDAARKELLRVLGETE